MQSVLRIMYIRRDLSPYTQFSLLIKEEFLPATTKNSKIYLLGREAIASAEPSTVRISRSKHFPLSPKQRRISLSSLAVLTTPCSALLYLQAERVVAV